MSVYFVGSYVAGALKPTRIRRRRVCNCPYCGAVTPLEPKARGEDDIAITACHNLSCCMVFENSQVASWLEDPL